MGFFLQSNESNQLDFNWNSSQINTVLTKCLQNNNHHLHNRPNSKTNTVTTINELQLNFRQLFVFTLWYSPNLATRLENRFSKHSHPSVVKEVTLQSVVKLCVFRWFEENNRTWKILAKSLLATNQLFWLPLRHLDSLSHGHTDTQLSKRWKKELW